jgi:hypothetical protein
MKYFRFTKEEEIIMTYETDVSSPRNGVALE